MDEKLDYEVVILYYRLGLELRDTVAHVLEQSVPPTRVVIVDNASGDGVASVVATETGVDFITAATNRGYAGGMNLGAGTRQGGASALLFLTHEVILDPNCAEKLLDALRLAYDGVVGPTLTLKGTGEVWSTGGLYEARVPSHRKAKSPEVAWLSDCDWLDGAAIMTRRATFERLCGFDESYFMYWEDIDFCTRARRNGSRIAVAKYARASQDTGTAPPFYSGRNSLIFFYKHEGMTYMGWALAQQILRALRELIALEPRRSVSRMKGIASGLRQVMSS